MFTANELVNGAKLHKQNEGLFGFGGKGLGGVAENIVGGAGSAFLSGLGGTAQFFGASGLGNLLNSGSEGIEEYLRPAKQAEFSWDYILSPEGLA